MSKFYKIYECSKASNIEGLNDEWDFIKKLPRQESNNTVPCICSHQLFAEINIYKNNKNDKCIFVGPKCSKKLQLKEITTKGKYYKINKLCDKFNITYKNNFTKIEDINKYLKYVIKKICKILMKELENNKYSLKYLQKLKLEIYEIFKDNEKYKYIIIKVNEYIKQEEERLEKIEKERIEREIQKKIERERQKRIERERLKRLEKIERERLKRKNNNTIEKIRNKEIQKKLLKDSNENYIIQNIIKEINIKLPSNNKNIESNINKYKRHYIENYTNQKIKKYNIEIYKKIFNKIINNNISRISNYFNDFKKEEIWPKISKIVILS